MKIMAKKLYVFYFFCLMNIIFINSALAEQIKELDRLEPIQDLTEATKYLNKFQLGR